MCCTLNSEWEVTAILETVALRGRTIHPLNTTLQSNETSEI